MASSSCVTRTARIVTGDYDDYANRYLSRGDQFEFEAMGWVMYDREDRGGVPVFLCRPATGAVGRF